jgi:hypothetical protein
MSAAARAPLSFGSLLCLLLAASPGRAEPPTPKQVDAAIKKGVAWLYSKQQQQGDWEQKDAPEGEIKGKDRNQPTGGQWGGYSAVATYALLDCGEPWKDERVKRACEWLYKAQIYGTYSLSLRANVWQYLPQSPNVRRAARRDADLLLGGMKTKGDADGFWGYAVNEGAAGNYDHSTSQFALLGVWACQQAGREVPIAFWSKSETAWGKHQYDDGSWPYVWTKGGNAEPRLSMTLAGVATLFLAQDYTRLDEGAACKGNVFDDRLVRGTKYIRDNFQQALTPGEANGRKFYNLYGVERVAMASGFKYFGDIDWYAKGAEVILKNQNADGSWGSVPDTAFALIFLSRGRAPVIANKFEYELEGTPPPAPTTPAKTPAKPPVRPQPANARSIRTIPEPTPAPPPTPAAVPENPSGTFTGNWHQRPRDVAVFTKWLSNTTERKLNWQIVSNRATVDDLHDAPVLYLSGNQKLALPDATVAKLKQYIEEGGLVFANADCTAKDFVTSIVQLGQKMFPKYEFRELPADHPIYTLQPFRRKDWKNPPSVVGLSNGTRELMIISPNLDLAKYWQNGNYSGRPEAYQLISCVALYAVDRQNLKYKGGSHVVRADGKAGELARKIKLARIEYAGNWDPEPAGWTRLAAILKNQKQSDLAAEPLKLGEGKLDAGYAIAHLTGTASLSIPKEQINDLRRFVIKGGTILVDSAGGGTEFADAAMKEFEPIIGGAKFEPIPADDPILAAIKDPAAAPITESMLVPPPPPVDPDAELPLGGKMPAATQTATQPTTRPPIAQKTPVSTTAATAPASPVTLDGNFRIEYRQFAKSRIGTSQNLRLKGLKFRGRWAVILSAEDLSTGLVGQQVDGIYGYTPACATEIVRRIVLNVGSTKEPTAAQ